MKRDWARGARRLLAVREVRNCAMDEMLGEWKTYDLALVFLLFRLSLRTRFFLHFALISTAVLWFV